MVLINKRFSPKLGLSNSCPDIQYHALYESLFYESQHGLSIIRKLNRGDYRPLKKSALRSYIHRRSVSNTREYSSKLPPGESQGEKKSLLMSIIKSRYPFRSRSTPTIFVDCENAIRQSTNRRKENLNLSNRDFNWTEPNLHTNNNRKSRIMRADVCPDCNCYSQPTIFNQKTNYANIKSKCGTLDYIDHVPGGGTTKIFNENVDYSGIQGKCGTTQYLHHKPGGGKNKIFDERLDFSDIKSKCGTFDNFGHSPGGGEGKIFDERLDYSDAKGKCGTLDYISHVPGGGKNKIFDERLDYSDAKSKCGTLDYISHVPGGGQNKIFDEKLDYTDAKSKCGTLDYILHVAGGGKNKIFEEWARYSHIKARCSTFANFGHVAGGGKNKVFNEKPDWTAVDPKVKSLENLHYKAFKKKVCRCNCQGGRRQSRLSRSYSPRGSRNGFFGKMKNAMGKSPNATSPDRSSLTGQTKSAKYGKHLDVRNRADDNSSESDTDKGYKKNQKKSFFDQLLAILSCKGSESTQVKNASMIMVYSGDRKNAEDTLIVKEKSKAKQAAK